MAAAARLRYARWRTAVRRRNSPWTFGWIRRRKWNTTGTAVFCRMCCGSWRRGRKPGFDTFTRSAGRRRIADEEADLSSPANTRPLEMCRVRSQAPLPPDTPVGKRQRWNGLAFAFNECPAIALRAGVWLNLG